MACPNWPVWSPGSGPTAAMLLNQIIARAGSNPDAAAAKAAALAGLVATAPKTSPTHDCAWYYSWTVLAAQDAQNGEWDACAVKLNQLEIE